MTEEMNFGTLCAVGFANPIFLWAMGLAVIPLWLHLSRRRKFKKLEVGTLRFLESAHRSRRRKARWEEILLMLLRIGATLLLALLFARPTLPGKAPEKEKANHTLVLIDASGSLTKEMTSEAKKQAEATLRKFSGSENTVSLAQFSDRVEPIESIEDFQPRPGAPSRFDVAVNWALDQFLKQGTPDAGRLILIGHFAHSALPENPPRVWPNGIEVEMIPLLPKEAINAAVTHIDLRTPYRKEAMEVEARLRLPAGKKASVTIEVEGFVEEKPLVAGTERVLFQFRPSRDRVRGWVTVKTEADDWPQDDRRPFVFQWTDQNRILLVDGDPGGTPFEGEAYFLKKALEASGAEHGLSPFSTEIVYGLENRQGLVSLDEFDAVALCGVGEITVAESRALAEYVGNGGGAFIVPGTGWAPALYASLIETGLFPPGAGESHGEEIESGIDSWDNTHPALAPFAPTGSGDLRSLPWVEGYEIPIAETNPNWQSIARLEGGRSILVASKTNRVLICPHPLNRDWTDLPRDPVFVPFVKGLFSWLAEVSEPPEPARTVIPGIGEDREPGWYLFGEERPPDVVVSDAAESNVATAELAEAAKALGLPLRSKSETAEQKKRESEVAAQFAPRPRELWPWVAVLLLIWLVIEGIFATAPKRGESAASRPQLAAQQPPVE